VGRAQVLDVLALLADLLPQRLHVHDPARGDRVVVREVRLALLPREDLELVRLEDLFGSRRTDAMDELYGRGVAVLGEKRDGVLAGLDFLEFLFHLVVHEGGLLNVVPLDLVALILLEHLLHHFRVAQLLKRELFLRLVLRLEIILPRKTYHLKFLLFAVLAQKPFFVFIFLVIVVADIDLSIFQLLFHAKFALFLWLLLQVLGLLALLEGR
jgi:hypothetical protein